MSNGDAPTCEWSSFGHAFTSDKKYAGGWDALNFHLDDEDWQDAIKCCVREVDSDLLQMVIMK